MSNLLAQAQSNSIFGTIDPPVGVKEYNALAGGGPESIGIIIFVSNLIRIGTVLAGLYVFYNIIMAGYIYITESGSSSAATKAKDQITNSIIGLVIIVAAYTITAIFSYFLFGNATFILNPQIQGPVVGGG
jgi:hypothetical protein